MTPNAMTVAEFCLEKDRRRDVFLRVDSEVNSYARVLAEGLIAGESHDYIQNVLAGYVSAKHAKDIAFQEYVQFLPPPAASDSHQQP